MQRRYVQSVPLAGLVLPLPGRNSEKQVPLLPDLVLDLTVILPRCLEIIPMLSHTPSPEPFSSLVVKKGSKIFRRVSAVIPIPESTIVMRTPAREVSFQSTV